MAEDLEAAANQNESKGSRGRRRRRRERKIRNRIISELPSYAKKQEEKEDGEADSSSSDDSDEEENEGINLTIFNETDVSNCFNSLLFFNVKVKPNLSLHLVVAQKMKLNK